MKSSPLLTIGAATAEENPPPLRLDSTWSLREVICALHMEAFPYISYVASNALAIIFSLCVAIEVLYVQFV
jgi:hypothetical protein